MAFLDTPVEIMSKIMNSFFLKPLKERKHTTYASTGVYTSDLARVLRAQCGSQICGPPYGIFFFMILGPLVRTTPTTPPSYTTGRHTWIQLDLRILALVVLNGPQNLFHRHKSHLKINPYR